MNYHQKLERNLKLIFWAELLGAINFLLPVSTLFYLHRGLVMRDIFIMLLVWVVSVFLGEVPTGAFADRYGPKRSFITGHFLMLLSTALLLVAHDPAVFYLSSALSAMGFTFFSGSDQSFIYETLKDLGREQEMSASYGRLQSGKFAPAALTILFGAYWAQDLTETQFLGIIVFGLVFNVFKLVLLGMLVVPNHFEQQPVQSPFKHMAAGWANLKGVRPLWLLYTNECLVMIPTYVLIADYSLAQPYLVDSGLAITSIGVVYAIAAALSTLGLNVVGPLEKGFGRVGLTYVVGLAIVLAFCAGAFLKPTPGLAVAVFFVAKIGVMLRYPTFAQIKNEYLPSASRATSLSLLSMADSAFDVLVLGSLALVSELGIRKVFLACAVFATIGLFFPVRLAQPILAQEAESAH